LFFPMPYSPSFIDLLSGGIATMVTRWIGWAQSETTVWVPASLFSLRSLFNFPPVCVLHWRCCMYRLIYILT
jgi:hypothetical protein